MDCSEAGKLGAAKRHQMEFEHILAKARDLNRRMGRPPDPRLNPTLILTKGDMI